VPAPRNRDAPCAVYRCYDAEEQLLYVGISADLRERFRQHNGHGAHWIPFMVRVDLTWHPDRETAADVERSLIDGLRPLFNKSRIDPDRNASQRRRLRYLAERGVSIAGSVWRAAG
jgi:predicted GIY-YIG superfamily endonuclease